MLTPIVSFNTPTLLGQSYNALALVVEFDPANSYNSLSVASGAGFTIVADIVDEDIATVGVNGSNGLGGPQIINAKLTIDDANIELLSFEYNEPTGKIGATLNARVDMVSLADVPEEGSVDLTIEVQTPNGLKLHKLLVDGKLIGRDVTRSFVGGDVHGPQDELVISAIDRVNDTLDLAPRRPVIMYNPRFATINVPTDPNNVSKEDYILDIAGNPILPIVLPRQGLTMYDIMRYAYSTKLGFNIQTNIFNFPVGRVDFGIEGTWHGSAASNLAIFDPVIFTSPNTVLHIMDIDQYLPTGYNSKIITPDEHSLLGDSKSTVPDRNAVIVTYEYNQGDWEDDTDPGGLVETVYTDVSVEPSGDPFDASYTVVKTSVTFVEVTNSLDPDTILAQYDVLRVDETFGNIVDPDTGDLTRKLISKEEIIMFYLGDLATGHAKTTWALVTAGNTEPETVEAGRLVNTDLDVDSSTNIVVASRRNTYENAFTSSSISVEAKPSLVPVTTEVNTIQWIDDPLNPGSVIQASNITVTEGLLYKSATAETVINPVTGAEQEIFRRWPILLAQSSGVMETDGTKEWGPINTVNESLIRIRKNQSKTFVRIIDHLNGTLKTSFGTGKVQNVGANVNENGNAPRSQSILLRDQASEAEIGPRVPESISISGLRKTEAMILGYRILHRFQVKKKQRPIELTGMEFSARRGSTFRVAERNGDLTPVYVTGRSVTGVNLGSRGHRIFMTLDTVRLLTR